MEIGFIQGLVAAEIHAFKNGTLRGEAVCEFFGALLGEVKRVTEFRYIGNPAAGVEVGDILSGKKIS